MDLETLGLAFADLSKSGTLPKCAFYDAETEDYHNTSDLQTSLIKSILQDDKESLVTISKLLSIDAAKKASSSSSSLSEVVTERAIVAKLLHMCCAWDAAECAVSLLNGEVLNGAVPLVNEVDDEGGFAPLHVAAAAHAARCVELLLKKRARTDLKTRDGRSLLPLELSLSTTRMDVIWNPEEHSVEDLVVQLSEKDLTTVKLLSEKTKEINEVAYGSAIGGLVVDLGTLLLVAAETVNESILEFHDADSGSKEKATIYECVIREALALGRTASSSSSSPSSSLRAAKRNFVPTKSESQGKRRLLLFEIELLQLFGAVAHTGCTDRKVTSPLILASQTGDEAIIELLLKSSIDMNDVDAEGNSALLWCLKTSKGSCPQQIRIMWLLLEHGARVNQKNKLGLTAVHIAAANGNLQALEILLLQDPDCIYSKTEMKETPLFFAVKNDFKDCAELLLRLGASTEVFNLRKQRPIDLAASQDMRFMLNPTNISLTNHALPIQQKYTARLQGDEVISEICEEVLTLTDEGNANDRTCLGAKTGICKYFESPTGCIRGTKCFYLHGEEELRKSRQGRDTIHSPAARDLEQKIFVGGLPPSLDSDSLGSFFEEHFGSVDDAIVVGVQTGDKMQSRGFGFVTFTNKKSVSAAIEAHYVNIMGKQVEIKNAVPKCFLLAELQKSPQQHEQETSDQHLLQAKAPQEKTTKEIPSWKTHSYKTKMEMLGWQMPSKKTKKEVASFKTKEEAKSELLSWVDTLIHGQPKACYNESQLPDKNMPAWFGTFKKWLPGFLQQVSKGAGEYALSSLKADFKAAFGLELDHASLGFQKLSDFMRSFPDLCRVEYFPIGMQKPANHLVLLPSLPRPKRLPIQPLTVCSPPSDATSIDGSRSCNGNSKDTKYCHDLPLSNEDDDFTSRSTKVSIEIPDENSEEKSPTANLRCLQILKPDPIFHARPWLHSECNGGTGDTVDGGEQGVAFGGKKPRTQETHLVLEFLAIKRNNSSVYFLREFDFYYKYKASIKQGKCFGCNQRRVLWANTPCQHLLWCADCKQRAMQAAANLEHKCVVCDTKVQNIDLISWHDYCQSTYDAAHIDEFPPFDPDYIRNLFKKKSPLTGN